MSILGLLDELVEREQNGSVEAQCRTFNCSTKLKCLFLRYKDHISSFATNTSFLWGGDANAEYIVDVLTGDNVNDDFEFLSVPSDFDQSSINGTDILIYSSNKYPKEYIYSTVDRLRPKVILHLSDDVGNRREYAEVFDRVRLVYREYKHPHYENSDTLVIKYMPIGYHSWGKKYRRGSPNPVEARYYKWCFSGDMKKQRQRETDALKSIAPYYCEQTKAFELTEIYQDSIFAYCPEGSNVVECSRIYEAMYNGCIPIVFSENREDLDQLRTMFGAAIPGYFTDDFSTVFEIINDCNLGDVGVMQQRCSEWIAAISGKIRSDVIEACK